MVQPMAVTRSEGKGRAAAIDFLPDLSGGLAVCVEIFQRKGKFAVDVAVTNIGSDGVRGQSG